MSRLLSKIHVTLDSVHSCRQSAAMPALTQAGLFSSNLACTLLLWIYKEYAISSHRDCQARRGKTRPLETGTIRRYFHLRNAASSTIIQLSYVGWFVVTLHAHFTCMHSCQHHLEPPMLLRQRECRTRLTGRFIVGSSFLLMLEPPASIRCNLWRPIALIHATGTTPLPKSS